MSSNGKSLNNYPGYAPLMDTFLGAIHCNLLLVSIELKIFDHLTKPRTSLNIAEKINGHPENIRRFLNALVSVDLLSKSDGIYCNTKLANNYLVSSERTYLGGMLLDLAQMQMQNSEDMKRLVLEGPPDLRPEQMIGREERWKQAAKNLVPYQKSGVASQAVAIISALPEFPAFRKMLDLGGGPGIIGQSIVSSHPHMTGVLFDLPMVVDAAESEIRNQGMENRMSILSGDYNIDSFGENYDLVWSSLNLYYAKNLTVLIRRIHESLNPGGIFVSFHEGLTDEKTSPPDFVLSRLAISLGGQELIFEQGEIASAMLDAGFQYVASRTVQTPHGPVDVDIARKAPQKSRT